MSRSPKLLSLMLLGFVLVSLPLVAALVTAIAKVDRLARETRNDMMAVQQNAVASRGFLERATAMERSARQFYALRDPSFLELYEEHRQAALELLIQLGRDAYSPELVAVVNHAREAELKVELLLLEAIDGVPEKATLEAALDAFRQQSLAVSREQNTISRQMASVLPDKASSLQRSLIVQAALAIPISMAVAAIFFIVVAPSLRQIGQGIRALGRGALGEPIHVKGAHDLAELGQRLEWLRHRLIELESQKAQFLRNVSHELKTPLTNIREGAELLLEDSAGGNVGELATVAQIVQANSIRLQKMIEALLRYGAEGDLTAGEPDQTVELHNLAAEVVERHAQAAATRNVALRQDLRPAVITGSPKRLQVIVDNLLSNALKYTPPGGHVEVSVTAGVGSVQLDVHDSGPGVAEQDRARIFDWFYSGPKPQDSIVAGSGMGLAIAQEYAEQHDGRIELVPDSGGAHFRLTLRKRVT
jgi:two-component system sensor histidine kinase GlrK